MFRFHRNVAYLKGDLVFNVAAGGSKSSSRSSGKTNYTVTTSASLLLPNAKAHRELLQRALLGLAEPQHGGDAVACLVRHRVISATRHARQAACGDPHPYHLAVTLAPMSVALHAYP